VEEKNNTYTKFIKNLHLKHFYTLELSSKREEDFHLPAKVNIQRVAEFKNTDKDTIKVYNTYTLSAVQEGKKEPGLLLSVTYCLIFDSKIEMTEEFFERFSASILVIETWPYFRNLVHETTMQMGLPPLVLDVVPKEIKSRETPVKHEQV
jgi:preprotein translocase subunit SecB